MIKYYLAELGSIVAPGPHPCGLAYEHLYDTLYYSDGDSNEVYRYEGAGEWTAVLQVPDIRTDLGFDGENLWQIVGPPSNKGIGSLQEIVIDRSGEIPKYKLGKRIDLPEGFKACGVDFKGSQAYVFGNQGTIVVDVRKDLFHLPFLPAIDNAGGMILFDSEMWVADFSHGEIVRVDSNREIIDRLKICESPTGITYGRGSLWINNFNKRQIVRYEVRY